MKGFVRIRLARMGRKHQPVYNIVVSQANKAPKKLPIEVLGMYHPVPSPLSPQEKSTGTFPTKDVRLDFLRAQYWLGVGAQPTPTVARIFKRAGILPPSWPGPNRALPLTERKVVQDIREAPEKAAPPVH